MYNERQAVCTPGGMEAGLSALHPVYMSKKVRPRFKKSVDLPRNFFRAWRESPKNKPGRKITLEEMVERLKEVHGISITHASLSRIERRRQPWGGGLLKALAAELTGGDEASLIMRSPDDPEGMWSIWDKASPGQRAMIVDLAKTVMKTGTSR